MTNRNASRKGEPVRNPEDGMTTLTHKDAYTYEEAADALRVSARTVRRLVAKGKLRAKRLDGTDLVRIERSEIKRYLGGSKNVEANPEHP